MEESSIILKQSLRVTSLSSGPQQRGSEEPLRPFRGKDTSICSISAPPSAETPAEDAPASSEFQSALFAEGIRDEGCPPPTPIPPRSGGKTRTFGSGLTLRRFSRRSQYRSRESGVSWGLYQEKQVFKNTDDSTEEDKEDKYVHVRLMCVTHYFIRSALFCGFTFGFTFQEDVIGSWMSG